MEAIISDPDLTVRFQESLRPILDLRPTYAYINDNGRVILEMAGGLDHFGVYAYPEDYEKPPYDTEELGHKKLLDGLWYYDDGFNHNPKYHQVIDKLIKEYNDK